MADDYDVQKDETPPASIEEICSATWEPVYRFIYYRVQNREEAEDITQEAYVKAMDYLRKNKVKPEKYIGFLKTVALNILRDLWRKKKRRGQRVDVEALNPKDLALDDPAQASTERMILEQALDSLNHDQRHVIELRILQGYSVADTAKVLEKKETTVRVIQYRALKNLSRILQSIEEGTIHDIQ